MPKLLRRARTELKLSVRLNDEERGTLAKILPGAYKSSAYRGVRGMLTAYSRSPWVRAVESKISDAVGATRWMLFGLKNASGKYVRSASLQGSNLDTRALALGTLDVEGDLVPILDHPLLRLLNYANPLFPGLVGRAQTQISLDLTGEAFWLLGPEEAATGSIVPERFWLLPSDWITAMPAPSNPYWEVQTPGWQGVFPEQAVLRFVTPDPVNPYGRGSGIFRAFGDEIDTDEYASQYVKSFFLNDATPRLLITGEGMSEADTRRMEVTWLQSLQGFFRAHRPFFIARKVDVQVLSQKFSDMELGELRRWERDIIVHGIGMPPEMLGITETSNRSTIDAADYLWSRWVIAPRLELQRAFLQQQLVPMYDDRLILAYQSPVQEDREYQLDVMKANPAVFTANDWKRQAGVEMTDDGDVYVMGFNQKVVADLTPTALLAAANVRAALGAGVQPTVVLQLAAADPLDAVGLLTTPATAAECGCTLPAGVEELDKVAAMRALPSGYVKQIGGASTTRLALDLSPQMQKEIIAAFRAMQNQIDYRALMAAFEAGNMEAAVQVLNEANLSADLEIARQTLRQALVIVGDAAAAELGTFLGTQLVFDLTNPESVAFLQEFGAEMVTNVSDETIAALRRMLEQAYADGMTSKQVADLIADHPGVGLTERDIQQRRRLLRQMRDAGLTEAQIQTEIDKWTVAKIKYRAQVIADNELTHAGNAGQRKLWDQAVGEGLIDTGTMRQWIVTPDDRLCVLCAPMGEPVPGISIVPMNQPYQTPTGAVFIPSEIHIRCRCTERILV
jgi:hypothetical protein